MSWRDTITRLSVAVMKKYEEEERKRLEKKESNNKGHANPLFDSYIDSDIDDEYVAKTKNLPYAKVELIKS